MIGSEQEAMTFLDTIPAVKQKTAQNISELDMDLSRSSCLGGSGRITSARA